MKSSNTRKAARGVPLGVVVVVLAVGVMFGGAMMAAFVIPPGVAVPAASTGNVPGAERPSVAPESPAAAITSFIAPVVSVGDRSIVVALPDLPHQGKKVPTVTVRFASTTAFSGRVPKSPQELDKESAGGSAVPDVTKGLPRPPERAESDLFKDVPMSAVSFLKDDVVRIETADQAGADAITATSVTLIYRPETPAESGAAPADGSQPAPSSIRPKPAS